MCADVSNVVPAVAPTTTPQVNTKTVTKTVSDPQVDFLQMLIAQISNQTPDSPMDATQMITQYAQMNAAVGLQKLADNVNAQKLTTATSLIHQNVSLAYTDPKTSKVSLISGEVTGVDCTGTNSEPRILVNGQAYSLDTVLQVGE